MGGAGSWATISAVVPLARAARQRHVRPSQNSPSKSIEKTKPGQLLQRPQERGCYSRKEEISWSKWCVYGRRTDHPGGVAVAAGLEMIRCE